MALEKTGYTAATQGTTRVNIAVDANGHIAPSGVPATGVKSFQVNKVSAENSLTDNTEVLEFLLSLAPGQQDSLSNTMQVKWGV